MKQSTKRIIASLLAVVLVSTLTLGVNAAPLTETTTITNDKYDDSETITFTFTDDSIMADVSDPGRYTIDEVNPTILTINAAGNYVFTGACTDGAIKVKNDVAGANLTLADLKLGSTSSAPLHINKDCTDTNVILVGSSTLIDKENPDESAIDFGGAALRIKNNGDLTIKGTGTLTLDGTNCKYGLTSGVSDGVNEGTPVTIESGTVIAKGKRDAINVHSLNITGGELTCYSGESGIKADEELNIGIKGAVEGPIVKVNESVNAIEAPTINLNSGVGEFKSLDNGVNATSDDVTFYDCALNVYGGYWYVDAEGDGFCSNGAINIEGGYSEVFGSELEDGAAFNYKTTSSFTAAGGTAVGIGRYPLAKYPSKGLYVMFGKSADTTLLNESEEDDESADTGEIVIQPGDKITITDSNNYPLFQTYAKKYADNIVFTHEDLVKGQDYILYIGSIAKATVKAQGEGGQVEKPTIVSTPESVDKTYTGFDQQLCTPGRVVNGKMQYALGTDGVVAPESGWTTSIPSRINPGTYYVWYRVKGDEGYTDIDAAYVGKPSTIIKKSNNVISIDEAAGTAVVYDDVAGTQKTVRINIIKESVVYRMYDPNRGEHFYTKDDAEMRNLVSRGWNHESDSDFTSVNAEDADAIPVYRLYNPNGGGMHFYTQDSSEAVVLKNIGWKYEGISHYVYVKTAESGKSQWRLYNPNSKNGEHNWTADSTEYRYLKSLGWRDEGICWKIK